MVKRHLSDNNQVASDRNRKEIQDEVYVMYAQVWGRPRATKHTKNASY